MPPLVPARRVVARALDAARRHEEAHAAQCVDAQDAVDEGGDRGWGGGEGGGEGEVEGDERGGREAREDDVDDLLEGNAVEREGAQVGARRDEVDERVGEGDPVCRDRDLAQAGGERREGVDEALVEGRAALDDEEVEGREGVLGRVEEGPEEQGGLVDHGREGEALEAERERGKVGGVLEREVEPEVAQGCEGGPSLST